VNGVRVRIGRLATTAVIASVVSLGVAGCTAGTSPDTAGGVPTSSATSDSSASLSATTPSTPAPTTASSSTATATKTVQPVTAASVIEEGQVLGFVSTGPGQLLVVWEQCANRNPGCRQAWELRSLRSEMSGLLRLKLVGYLFDASEFAPAGRDYIIKGAATNGQPGMILHPDGTITRLHAGPKQPFRPRDVLVWSSPSAWAAFADPRTGDVWTPAKPDLPDVEYAQPGTQVDDNGTPWVLTIYDVNPAPQIVWRDSSGWHARHRGAATAIWNRPDGSTQVITVGSALHLTTNGGVTWHTYPGSDFPFHPKSVTSVAADSSGTLYVVDGSGHVWRSTDTSWIHFTRMMRGTTVVGVQQAGDSVLAQLGSTKVRVKVVWLSGSTHTAAISIP